MRTDGKQERRRILANSRQRPVGLVAPAMAVEREEMIESLQEPGACERRSKARERAVVLPKVRGRTGLMTRDVRQRDEIDRLLGADRSRPRGKLWIDEPLIGETDGVASLPDQRFPEHHS